MILELSETEARLGVSKTITLKTFMPCNPCLGRGYITGEKKICETCNGCKAIISFKQFDRIRLVCPGCEGQGYILEAISCEHCVGTGKVEEPMHLDIVFPPGTESGVITHKETKINVNVIPDTWTQSLQAAGASARKKLPTLRRKTQ